MSSYEHRHVVGFEETSLIGNVYFSHYLEWQGRCRESFLYEHAREVVAALQEKKLAFFTLNCACDFRGAFGFTAADVVLIHMQLERFRGGRMTLSFEYAHAERPTELVAHGTQEVACMAPAAHGWSPVVFPAQLVRALKGYAEDPKLLAALDDALAFQQAH